MSYYDESYVPVEDPFSAGTGVYHIIGKSNFGCLDTSTVSVTVNPIANADIILANQVEKCSGSDAMLTAEPLESANIENPVFRWHTVYNHLFVPSNKS